MSADQNPDQKQAQKQVQKLAQKLARQLKNVGPKMAEKLLAAGIDSPAALKALGAKKAYNAMYPDGDSYGDHNAAYLHALEGAIRDCDWKDIPEKLKQEYRDYARQLQVGKTGGK